MDSVTFSTETINNLRYIVHSAAWTDYFVPTLASLRESWVNSLIDGSVPREFTDEYMRGCITTLDALLALPNAVIADADAETARRERERAQDDHFVNRANLGTP